MEHEPAYNEKRSILTQGALPIIAESDETSRLDGENLSDLEETFSLFDVDGNGMISLQELTSVLQSLGKEFAEEDIKEMLEIADKDGDGQIGFDDFHDLMKETILRGIQEDDLQEAFDVLDSDKDGFITPLEMHQSLINIGESVTIEEALEIITEVDLNGDGLVDFEEFKVFYMKGKQQNRRKTDTQ
eukprot:gene2776-999_t